MTDNVTLLIDGQEVSTEQGKTLLDVARDNGKDVPTICYHDATTANGLCRMCVVEVEGMRVLQPACIVQA
jgi:NADH dehydrogenase/NADH:ubiquinone oxidoreductase subunit G